MKFKSLFFEDYYNSCFSIGEDVKIGILESYFREIDDESLYNICYSYLSKQGRSFESFNIGYRGCDMIITLQQKRGKKEVEIDLIDMMEQLEFIFNFSKGRFRDFVEGKLINIKKYMSTYGNPSYSFDIEYYRELKLHYILVDWFNTPPQGEVEYVKRRKDLE